MIRADLSTWATLEHCQRYDLRIGPADKTRSTLSAANGIGYKIGIEETC
jgi:hypothetical protein